jgi:hypothetical protein
MLAPRDLAAIGAATPRFETRRHPPTVSRSVP